MFFPRSRPRRHLVRGAALLIPLSTLVPSCSPTPSRLLFHYDNGRQARATGDLELALREFGKAIDLTEKPYPAALLERAETLLKAASGEAPSADQAQKIVQAMDDLQAVVNAEETSLEERARALHGLGRARLLRRESQAAASRFREILDLLEPSSARDSKELERHYLEAHRQLGRILLEEALSRTSLLEPPISGNAPGGDPFRPAQEYFSRCLEVAPADALCSLGKGICLHLRGQSGAAVPFLERGVRADVPAPWNGYKAHYFLARALEEASGFQKRAIEHYREALREDPYRTFLPLYSRLTVVLRYYDTPAEPSYESVLRRLLEYEGDEEFYWSRIAGLGTGLTNSVEPRLVALGYETLAVAYVRLRQYAAAAESVAALRNRENFLDIVDRLFAVEGEHLAQHAFARAQALFSAGEHARLEEWFENGIRTRLESLLHADEAEVAYYARRALVIHGKNLVSKCIEEHDLGSSAPPYPSRDTPELAEAIGILQRCLSIEGKDQEALLGLAKAHEILGSYSEALSRYGELAARHPSDAEVFRRIRELHRAAQGEHELTSWNLLQKYTGDASDLVRYIERTRESILAEVHLYCIHCGRRGNEEDGYCLECGRPLSSTVE